MQYLPEAINLLKSLGLNQHKSTFQAAAVMLASSIGISDSSDVQAKRECLAEAVRVLKDTLKVKPHDVDPLAAMLLAATIAQARLDKKAAEEAAEVAHDKEIINNSIPDYAARVSNGEPPGDVAIQFVSDMETLLNKPLPGLLESVNKHFSRIQPEEKTADVPADPDATPAGTPDLVLVKSEE